ncbi:MAG: hypothetical protein PHC38_06485 [Weeksellaceae bacterium]|nr:hypothetical protein [Weeksellaceae bacterium]
METLLDKERKNKVLLAEREKNVRELKRQLAEARMLFSIIPSGTYAEQQERLVVGNEMRRLNSLIASEMEAIQELESPSDKEVGDVLNLL